MIKLTHSDPNFDRLHYVSRAIAKKDMREHFNYLYVDEGRRAIGTNGHRMHFAITGKYGRWLEPGFYTVLKRTKTMLWLENVEVDSKFPGIDFIIEGRPNGHWQTIRLTVGYGASIIGYRAAKDYDLCLQYPYIEDAIAYSETFAMSKGNDQLWFSFDGGDVQAVIMKLNPNL